jgi:hypothetical protein
LGWGLYLDGGDPDGAEGWPEDEGGDGSPRRAGDGIHRGPHPLDGHQSRTAGCAVSCRQVSLKL